MPLIRCQITLIHTKHLSVYIRPPSEGDSLLVEYQGFLTWTQTIADVVKLFDIQLRD